MIPQGIPDQNQLLASLRQMADQTTDPMKKMLVQMALQKAESIPAAPAPPPGRMQRPDTATAGQMRQDILQLLEMNRELMAAYRALQTEHQQWRDWNRQASSATGACQCWGFDPNCPDCQGQGIAGTFEVDVPGFQRLMQPFVARLVQSSIQTAKETQSSDPT